jgi:hypothetical protein
MLLHEFVVNAQYEERRSPLTYEKGHMVLLAILKPAETAMEARAAPRYALEGICEVHFSIAAVNWSS